VHFHDLRHPADLGRDAVQAFLGWLATEQQVSVSTHKQALSALLFLYQKVLQLPVPWMSDVNRPQRAPRLPVVLSHDEVARVLAALPDDHRLFGQLREALNRNELELWFQPQMDLRSGRMELWFQPQMDLRSGRIVGAEALARWRKANGEFVPPSEFVPVAEQSGLIKPFTKWVLRAFFKEVGKWQAAGLDLHYSANLSARNLADPEILVDLASLLVKEGVNANHVVLELTESSFAEHPEQLMKMATQLNAMSFRQSIDDFGTGYSSLSYLKDLPVDELKIDQSFIRNLLQDESSAAIVKSTIQLAHNLGLKVVAEGIETPEVAAALLAAGCDIGQGYHFSKALPPAEFLVLAKAAL